MDDTVNPYQSSTPSSTPSSDVVNPFPDNTTPAPNSTPQNSNKTIGAAITGAANTFGQSLQSNRNNDAFDLIFGHATAASAVGSPVSAPKTFDPNVSVNNPGIVGQIPSIQSPQVPQTQIPQPMLMSDKREKNNIKKANEITLNFLNKVYVNMRGK